MRKCDVIVIGGGQSGLVMSRSLTVQGIDHVVLERGRIGERWCSERWRSLNLLTTNALSALPDLPHANLDPDAFMTAGAYANYLDTYAQSIAAPILSEVNVTDVTHDGVEFRVCTSVGEWRSGRVVVATGACDTPYRPSMAGNLASCIHQINPSDYREPTQLPTGGVLVVGASATGAQLAEEIHASGRPVTLSVGEHTRVPRRYRGRDTYAWMETTGILDDPALESGNLDAARRQPSLQLVGRPDNRDLDLGILQAQGIRLVGRLAAVEGTSAKFNDDLASTTSASHSRMLRILDRIDGAIMSRGLRAGATEPSARIPFRATGGGVTLDLNGEGIRSIVWATGYARRYPWLHVPVLDGREIIHRGGVAAVPGLYVLGLTFLRRRRSSFIDGCGLDADDLAPMIKSHLNAAVRRAA